MNEFHERFIAGTGIDPPREVSEAFQKLFREVVNLEWYNTGEGYEAVFYQEEVEHLALFDKEGKFMMYKLYLPEMLLPERILSGIREQGEIMNAVLTNRKHCIRYELIVKDNLQRRKMLVLSEMGKVLEEFFL